jgi:hypothetical protein
MKLKNQKTIREFPPITRNFPQDQGYRTPFQIYQFPNLQAYRTNDLQVYGSPIIQTGSFHFQPGAAPVGSMVLVAGL